MNPSPPDLQRYSANLLHSASSVLPATFGHRLHQTKPAGGVPQTHSPSSGCLGFSLRNWALACCWRKHNFSATSDGLGDLAVKDLGIFLLQILRYTLRLVCQLSLKYTEGKPNNYFNEFHCNEVF